MDVVTARVTVPETIARRTIGDDTIVLNVETGRYYRLNETAGEMFAALAEAPSVGDAARMVAAGYGLPVDEVEADMLELCRALAQRGLVDFVDAA